MKTINSKIAGLFWILGLFFISINGNSQDNKLSRQEHNALRKAQLTANFNILDSLLNAKSFVLEADYLQGKYGDIIPVTSTLNFVKVDSTNGILQTGTTSGIGYNDVGGVTAEGTIGSWKLYKDTGKQTLRVQFSLLTNIGNYDVSLWVTPDNYATARITGLGPGELTWRGHLATVENSRVFKGRNTI